MRRVTVAAASVVTALVVGGVTTATAVQTDGPPPVDDPGPGAEERTTVPVERRDLAEIERLEGELGYGDTRQVTTGRSGTVTWLPDGGDRVERGDAVARIDEIPVPLLYGDIPLWRALDASVQDGDDVRQLEENLLALGFGDESASFPDDDFDWRTRQALREWQDAAALDKDGRLDLGEIVVAAGPVRVSSVNTEVGAQLGGQEPLLEVSGLAQIVTVDLAVSDAGLLTDGDSVRVELPDGIQVDGTVQHVGRTVEERTRGDGGTEQVFEVMVALSDTDAGATFDIAPVKVHVTHVKAEQVLAVPVHALLATAGDGYVVERSAGAGSERVPVRLGAVADGWAEVTGDVAEGDEVVVPR